MFGGRFDDGLLQIGTLTDMGNAQCLTGFIGQGVHDRGKKVISADRHPIERFATLIKCLIGRSLFHDVLATGG
ncbi:hypothetical protein D3C87_1036560 [compost metagenome]